MKNRTSITAAVLMAITFGVSLPSQASDAGAFVGGMMASRVMSNMHQRTQAEQQQADAAQQQAYNSQQSVQQAAPASAQTLEQRIKQLDKLAAGGYITPAEYKTKKQAIIDSM